MIWKFIIFVYTIGQALIILPNTTFDEKSILIPDTVLIDSIEKINMMVGSNDDNMYEPIKMFNENNPYILAQQLLNLFTIEFFKNVEKDTELYCLAQNSYWESRGESFTDKLAVANVVMNRKLDRRYPKTICGVIKEANHGYGGHIIPGTCQFSWYCSGLNKVKINITNENKNDPEVLAWIQSILAAMIAKNHLLYDNSFGATHFYAHNNVMPSWSSKSNITVKFENHTFIRIPYQN